MDLNDIEVVVFETTGEITIISRIPPGRGESLKDVKNYPVSESKDGKVSKTRNK